VAPKPQGGDVISLIHDINQYKGKPGEGRKKGGPRVGAYKKTEEH